MDYLKIKIVELPELPKKFQDDLSLLDTFEFEGDTVKIVMIEDGWRIALQKVENVK